MCSKLAIKILDRTLMNLKASKFTEASLLNKYYCGIKTLKMKHLWLRSDLRRDHLIYNSMLTSLDLTLTMRL